LDAAAWDRKAIRTPEREDDTANIVYFFKIDRAIRMTTIDSPFEHSKIKAWTAKAALVF